MDSTSRVGCRSGRAITRADIPTWIRVDDEGRIWSTHNLGGYPCPEREVSGTLGKRGYLTTRLNGPTVLVHRVVYAWHYGEAPAGVLVRHLNDNRTDNRPSNLALGTAQDNSDDARRNGSYTGNHARGIRNVNAKMTPEKVREIRAAYRAGGKQIPLAQQYGISQASLWAIVNYKTWRDVPD